MKKLLLTTALYLLCIASTWAANYDFSAVSGENTLYYRITNTEKKEVAIVSETDIRSATYNIYPRGTLIIPETVSNGGIDYTVTSIGKYAFKRCGGLTGSLTIPNSVTDIHSDAFDDDNHFSGSLSIGIGLATYYINMLPLDHKGFTEFIVSADNPSCSTQDGILYNKDKTEIIYCPRGKTGSLTIPNNVTSIGKDAFRYCSTITKIVMKSEMPPIVGVSAFYGMTLCFGVFVPAGAGDYYDIGYGGTDDGKWQEMGIIESAPEIHDPLYVELYEVGAKVRYTAKVEYGASSQCYITAEAGSTIVSVTVNGSEVSLSAEGLLELNNIQEDKIVLVKTQEDEITELRSAEVSSLTTWVAMEILFVELSHEMEQIRVVDAAGRVIYSEPTNGYEILQVPLSQAGAYIVQAQMQDGSVQTAKVVR